MVSWRVGLGLVVSAFIWLNGNATSVIPPYQMATCIACHGVQGEGLTPVWPNIGGQSAPYLLKQMYDMKEGKKRLAPIMMAVLSKLTETDMVALAQYYAKLPLQSGIAPNSSVQKGEEIYRGGNYAHHVSACIACHGPGGEGNGQAGFPVLSGQHALYTIQQLQAFKKGTRQNDLNEIMRDISRRMSDEEIEAVAYYIQGLYPVK